MKANIRWGIYFAGPAFAIAFILSLLLGHTNPLIALLRAGIFGGLFFGLGVSIQTLIQTFIPELLSSAASRADVVNDVFAPGTPAGSQVNITVDDPVSPALPVPHNEESSPHEVGTFNDLIEGSIKSMQDIDQNPKTSYTDDNAEELTPTFDNDAKADGAGDFSMDFGAFIQNGSGNGEMGEDLGDMDSFSFFSDEDDAGKAEDLNVSQRKVSKNKPVQFEGDFNAKEIAAGLRTVLEKDKK